MPTPWGYITTPRGLVATASVRERNERAELGETAILLCEQLGVTRDQLEALREVRNAAPDKSSAPSVVDAKATSETPLADPSSSDSSSPNLVAALEAMRANAEATP